jgi:hypothetical protein
MAPFSGFYESHEPPPSGDAYDSTGTPPRPSKRIAKLVHLSLLFCLMLPWQLPRQYGASSRPMAASSDFRCIAIMDVLHREMHFVSHRCTTMAIEMAGG